MVQELNENPDFPKRPAFEAQTSIGDLLVTIEGASLSDPRYGSEYFRHASGILQAFISSVTRARFLSMRGPLKKGGAQNPYVLWVNDLPYSVRINALSVKNVSFSEGSIKIRTALTLAVTLQGLNLSYDVISKYPSFKQGLRELVRDIEYASSSILRAHEKYVYENKRKLPDHRRKNMSVQVELFREDDETIENSLKRIVIANDG